jgi:hypothetical protein
MNREIRKILQEIDEVFREIQKKCGGYPQVLNIAMMRAEKVVDKEELKEIIDDYKAEFISEEEIPFPIFEIGKEDPKARIKFADYLFLPGHGGEVHRFNIDNVIFLAKRFKKVGWYDDTPTKKEGYIVEFKDFMKELKKIAEEVKSDEYIYNIIKCWVEELEK